MMREDRTTKQITADKLDEQIFDLASALCREGYHQAATRVGWARVSVRKDMHPDDKKEPRR